MCSLVITNITGSIVIIDFRSNIGSWNLGIVNSDACITGVKSTIFNATLTIYPVIIAIKIGIVAKNFLNKTEPKIATDNVTKKTITSFVVLVSVIIFAPILPPETVACASSNPIKLTTLPIAAGGKTTSIQSVPNL